MGCSACGGGNKHVTLYQVRYPNGTTKRFATEGEAWASANRTPGASMEVVKQKSAPS